MNRLFLLLSVFVLLSCQKKPAQPARPCVAELILFEADWCQPCRQLQEEMSKRNIRDRWIVQRDKCQYGVPIRKIEMTENLKQEFKDLKQTDRMPEQVLLWCGRVVDSDNYSNVDSVNLFLKRALDRIDQNGQTLCKKEEKLEGLEKG